MADFDPALGSILNLEHRAVLCEPYSSALGDYFVRQYTASGDEIPGVDHVLHDPSNLVAATISYVNDEGDRQTGFVPDITDHISLDEALTCYSTSIGALQGRLGRLLAYLPNSKPDLIEETVSNAAAVTSSESGNRLYAAHLITSDGEGLGSTFLYHYKAGILLSYIVDNVVRERLSEVAIAPIDRFDEVARSLIEDTRPVSDYVDMFASVLLPQVVDFKLLAETGLARDK